MIWRLLLFFTVVPAVELFLLLQIGSWLGPTSTFLMILLTGVLGAALAKREGLHLLSQLREELQRGLPPGTRLVEGVMVVVGGLLLVSPGVLSDLAGVLLILGPSRRWLAPRILRRFTGSVELGDPGLPPGNEQGVRYRVEPRPEAAPSAGSKRKKDPFATPFDD